MRKHSKNLSTSTQPTIFNSTKNTTNSTELLSVNSFIESTSVKVTPLLILLVLSAAVLHAVWNAMAKSDGTPEITIASYQLTGTIVCIGPALFWFPFPNHETWPMIFGSAVIHNFYYFALARAYRAGDLSQVYPIFRGMAPVLVALGAAIFGDEYLSKGTFIGIIFISVGVISLAFNSSKFGAMPPKALIWAVITTILIATYTVFDGLGIRAASNKMSYIVWLFTLEIIPIGSIMLVTRGPQWRAYLIANRWKVVAGGLASGTAYALVIYAMSLGAMAVVSSLRETSVIFAAIIGTLFLREPFGKNRIRAAILVAAGIILMRWLDNYSF